MSQSSLVRHAFTPSRLRIRISERLFLWSLVFIDIVSVYLMQPSSSLKPFAYLGVMRNLIVQKQCPSDRLTHASKSPMRGDSVLTGTPKLENPEVASSSGYSAIEEQLPPELIAELFRYTLDNQDNVLSKARALLLLRAVCRRWKQVAETDCKLWASTIYVRGSHGVRHLTHWIEKAGDMPLNIAFVDSEKINSVTAHLGPRRTFNSYEVKQFFGLLLPKIHNVRSFSAALSEPAACAEVLRFFAQPPIGMSVLTKLDIRLMSFLGPRIAVRQTPEVNIYQVPEESSPIGSNPLTPQANERSTLYSPVDTPTVAIRPASLPGVRTLNLFGLNHECIDADIFQRLLGMCPALEDLTLVRVSPRILTQRQPVAMPSIRTLKLSISGWGDQYGGILTTFSTPHVHSLTVCAMEHDHLTSLLILTAGKYASVRALTLEHLGTQPLDMAVQPWILARWMSTMPAVETLVAHAIHPDYMRLVVEPVQGYYGLPPQLTAPAGATLFPRLRFVDMCDVAISAQDVLEGRAMMNTPLQQLIVDGWLMEEK